MCVDVGVVVCGRVSPVSVGGYTAVIQGAKEEGAKGFFKGFGKGIIGAAACARAISCVLVMRRRHRHQTRRWCHRHGVQGAPPLTSQPTPFNFTTILPLHHHHLPLPPQPPPQRLHPQTTEGITSQASSLRGKKAAVAVRSARGFYVNGTVLPLHGDAWAMQQASGSGGASASCCACAHACVV